MLFSYILEGENMTKDFLYKNIKKLEEFAIKEAKINKSIDEILIQNEAKGTDKTRNFFIQFVYENGYTEISEIDDDIVIITLQEQDDKNITFKNKIPSKNFFKEFRR